MADGIVIRNDLDLDGVRCVHLLAQARLLPASAREHSQGWNSGMLVSGIFIPSQAEVKEREDEIHLHHLEATWKARGDMVEFRADFPCRADCLLCRGSGCSWRRVVALWLLQKGERISQAVERAAMAYSLETGLDPVFAWVRTLPKGVEWGIPIAVGGTEILLFEAKWMPGRAVAVGRGN
jgi:hypothetical protein